LHFVADFFAIESVDPVDVSTCHGVAIEVV
jgi:hypothetical protein